MHIFLKEKSNAGHWESNLRLIVWFRHKDFLLSKSKMSYTGNSSYLGLIAPHFHFRSSPHCHCLAGDGQWTVTRRLHMTSSLKTPMLGLNDTYMYVHTQGQRHELADQFQHAINSFGELFFDGTSMSLI